MDQRFCDRKDRNESLPAIEERRKAGREQSRKLKKREGVPEMGTKPLKALRGYWASNRGSNRGSRGSNRGSNRGSKGSRKTPEALRG